jgi:predicted Rossmann fold flavoprotein
MGKAFDCIVIGGGASGLMSALIAGKKGKSVLILEKNDELGKKLKITGGGRCNILNANPNENELLKKYGDDAKFLHSVFANFGVDETIKFFESIGIKIKIENEYRAFPETEKALDVFNALLKEINKYNVEIRTSSKVEEILFEKKVNEKYKINCIKLSDESIICADQFILATGGYSHPETGSTGEGFNFLKNIGIKINSPNPDLVPVKIEEKYIYKLSSKTIDNIKISLLVDGIKADTIRPTITKTNKTTRSGVSTFPSTQTTRM